MSRMFTGRLGTDPRSHASRNLPTRTTDKQPQQHFNFHPEKQFTHVQHHTIFISLPGFQATILLSDILSFIPSQQILFVGCKRN